MRWAACWPRVLGKGLIESHGWQSVFLAAALPVVLIPFILKSLPESMPFLLKQGRHDELKAIVARLDPSFRPTAERPLRAARRRQGRQRADRACCSRTAAASAR